VGCIARGAEELGGLRALHDRVGAAGAVLSGGKPSGARNRCADEVKLGQFLPINTGIATRGGNRAGNK
jgi:hypothetical protein